MIEVKIGAAAHSLNANQRRLLELLRDGKTPYECSRIMGIGLQYSGGAYPPPCNIMDMISEIRAAGYDVPTYAHDRLARTFAEIPQNKKEDNTMYTKHGEDVKQQAQQLREQGLSAAKIGEQLGVPSGTVKKWVYGDTAKEKPVSESTDTGKEEKEVLTEDKPVEGIVTQAAEKVKYTFSEITIQAMADAISDCIDDIARLSEQVDGAMMHLTKKQVELEEKQAQLAAMEADYNIICGGMVE